MTAIEPPSGRALSHASDLASIRACVAARCLLVPEQATAVLAERDELARQHADCSNLSHAEASRIVEEARQMRGERDSSRRLSAFVAKRYIGLLEQLVLLQQERDAAREALAMSLEAGDTLKRLLRVRLDADEHRADWEDPGPEEWTALENRIAEQQHAIDAWDRALVRGPKREGW